MWRNLTQLRYVRLGKEGSYEKAVDWLVGGANRGTYLLDGEHGE